MFVRTLAIQGSWNYELLVGNGVAFCVEPALRRLPGGVDGPAYRASLARQSAYFNAHPYLAGYTEACFKSGRLLPMTRDLLLCVTGLQERVSTSGSGGSPLATQEISAL